jgi:putative spermidine/putrescine transport system permease protein
VTPSPSQNGPDDTLVGHDTADDSLRTDGAGGAGGTAETSRAVTGTGGVPAPSAGPLDRLSAAVGRRLLTLIVGLTVLFLIGPVLLTFGASFFENWTGLAPSGSLTLTHWKQALGLTETVGASRGLGTWIVDVPFTGLAVRVPASIAFSMLLALGGVFVNLLVGVPIAYAVTRYDFYGRDLLNTVAVLPIVPGIVLGIAFLRTYPNLPSAIALVIGYSLLKAPYMVLAVQSSFESMDLRQLEESARSLGASWPRTFLSVILPNAKRGIVSGSIICWTLAAAEFNFSYIVYSRGPKPFSLFLFENISNNPFQRAAAAVSIYFLLVAAVTALLRATGERGFSTGGVR